jgi:hypothetical protein
LGASDQARSRPHLATRAALAGTRAVLSFAVILAFILWCISWGKQGPQTFPYGAEGVWWVLAWAIALLWRAEPKRVTLVVAGAVSATAVWSVTMVDFPPTLMDRHELIALAVSLTPALLAGVVGVCLRDGYCLSGALMLLLGGVGVFPIAIWNTEIHVAGGWLEYPYPEPVSGLIGLVIMAGLGAGGAALGHRIAERRRWQTSS